LFKYNQALSEKKTFSQKFDFQVKLIVISKKSSHH